MVDRVDLRKYLDRRLVALRDERSSWWSTWTELSDFILPRRGRFNATPNQGTRGKVKTNKIIDDTATLAARALASGMMAGVTSPARPWFRLTLGDADLSDTSPVKLWLDAAVRRMQRVLAQSNVYNALHVSYEEVSVFGTAVLMLEEDPVDLIVAQPLTVGEYFLANNWRNQADTLFREFTMTVSQVVSRFGIEAVSTTVKSLYQSGQLDREIIVGHAIEPDDARAGCGRVTNRAYRSIYWEIGQTESQILEIAGYDELPFCAYRWHLVANDPYGACPGTDTLGTVKSLQLAQLRSHQAIDKIVNPPMIADVNMKQEKASLLPGGITYVASQSGVGFKPAYEVPPNISGIELKIKEAQDRINEAFFKNLWLKINQLETVRTATEIQELRKEIMLQLGPVLERIQYELLDPLIRRLFRIMLRNGLLPPMPREIQGRSIDIQYVSTLAGAQKAVDTTEIERLVAFVGNIAAAKPEALDKIDTDEMIDDYADMMGVSPKLLVPTQAAMKTRMARAKAAQQQQATQNAMAAVQGAQTLSQTEVGGGQSALQRMIGGPQ
jgi:hypothetical protein